MTKLKAIVFTRPYPIGLGDYTFFERPVEFAKDREFDAHIRNVLHEDDAGIIGSIVGRRWHVLRQGDFVIVGMATNEFGRRDEGKRPIRGYYGFAMLADDIVLPSEDLFKELDKLCVEPSFMQAPVKTKNSEWLAGGIFEEPAQYIQVRDSGKWQFNMKTNRIRFHVYEDLQSILLSSIAVASRNSTFEIVIGLNTVEHAKRKPILNCVCHAVPIASEIEISVDVGLTQNENTAAIAHRKTFIQSGSQQSTYGTGKFDKIPESSSGLGVISDTKGIRSRSPGRCVESGVCVGEHLSLGGHKDASLNGKGLCGADRGAPTRAMRSRIVVDFDNTGGLDRGLLRELLSRIERVLELFGWRGHCRIESAPAEENIATGVVKTDRRKLARGFIEQGFGKKQ